MCDSLFTFRQKRNCTPHVSVVLILLFDTPTYFSSKLKPQAVRGDIFYMLFPELIQSY